MLFFKKTWFYIYDDLNIKLTLLFSHLDILDGFFMGLGFTAILIVLGAFRELIGFGTLFQQMSLLFGEGAEWLTITVFENYDGFLLTILPPGAFLGLGLIIALKNVIDTRIKQTVSEATPQQTAT